MRTAVQVPRVARHNRGDGESSPDPDRMRARDGPVSPGPSRRRGPSSGPATFWRLVTALSVLVGVSVASASTAPPVGARSEAHEPPAGRYEIRSSDSHVGYRIFKLGMVPIRGQLGSVRGEIVVDTDRPERSRAEVVVPLASLQSGNEKRTETLLSEDFFHAERHPAMRFVSRRVSRSADGRWLVSGDLTIRGVTRTVTFSVEIRRGQGLEGPQVVFSTRFEIDRTEFGVLGEAWSGGRTILSDRVEIELALAAQRR